MRRSHPHTRFGPAAAQKTGRCCSTGPARSRRWDKTSSRQRGHHQQAHRRAPARLAAIVRETSKRTQSPPRPYVSLKYKAHTIRARPSKRATYQVQTPIIGPTLLVRPVGGSGAPPADDSGPRPGGVRRSGGRAYASTRRLVNGNADVELPRFQVKPY
jgi:hypothetical protein